MRKNFQERSPGRFDVEHSEIAKNIRSELSKSHRAVRILSVNHFAATTNRSRTKNHPPLITTNYEQSPH
jgi:hypothetical protein